MAIIDIGGGKYRDIDTDRQFCDVIAENISQEFADIIADKIAGRNAEFDEIREEYEHLDRVTDEWQEVFGRVSGMAAEYRQIVDSMARMDKKKIVRMFKEIENEVEQYT